MSTGLALAAALLVLGPANERPDGLPDETSARDAFVGLLDARGVSFVQGHGPALYLEAGGGRWFCVKREETALRCHTWPDGTPRLTSIHAGYSGNETEFFAATADAQFRLRVNAGTEAVSVRKLTCKPGYKPLDFSLPPSRQPKRRPLRCDRSLAGTKLTASDDELPRTVATAFTEWLRDPTESSVAAVTSVEHQGHGVVSVGAATDHGWDGDRWTCLRFPGSKRACGHTQYSSFDAVGPQSTLPGAWLLMVEGSSGYLGGSVELVWAAGRDGKLATATLDVGGIACYRDGCASFPGTCVACSGAWVDWEFLAPSSVRIGRTVQWTATHVRAPDHWIHERILPPRRKPLAEDEDSGEYSEPLEPGTYSPGPDG